MNDAPALKRPRGRLFTAVLVVSAATLSLSGCVGGASIHEHAGVALITDSSLMAGDEAAISGTLTVTGAGCVGISDAAGNVYPTIWPPGTTLITASTTTIDIPGVGRKRAGDTVTGAGGYYGTAGRASLKPIAARCKWTGKVIGIRFS